MVNTFERRPILTNKQVIQVRYGRWLVGAVVIAIIVFLYSLFALLEGLKSEPSKFQRDVTATEVTVEVKSYREHPRAKTLDCLENGPQAQFSCTRSEGDVPEFTRPEWLWPDNLFAQSSATQGVQFCPLVSEADL